MSFYKAPPKQDGGERQRIMEQVAEEHRRRQNEQSRPMNPDRDFTWDKTNFESNDYE